MTEGDDAWATNWSANPVKRRGGTSTVVQVVHRVDGRLGALKRLEDNFAKDRDRRFRMQREVNSLRAVGEGVPQLYDSNADEWEDPDAALFAVFEWIPGPTLSEATSATGTLNLDDGLTLTGGLLDTLARAHDLDVVHRDIKPDNIVLRDGKAAGPVLLDFGLAWAPPSDGGVEEFPSELRREIGNRFLRLPENAPGRRSRDPRSDVTMVAAIMLYALSGTPARVLRDENGMSPEQAIESSLSSEVLLDHRWPRLRRLFRRAFQPDLAARFQSIGEFNAALQNLDPGVSRASDPLGPELEQLEGLLATKEAEELAEAQSHVKSIGTECFAELSKRASAAGFSTPGSHGFVGTGAFYKIQCGLQRSDLSGGLIRWARVNIYIEANQFRAESPIEGSSERDTFFDGPIFDQESLREAVLDHVPTVLARAIASYRSALARQLQAK